MSRETARDAFAVVSVLVVVGIVAGQLAGQPVFLGYVTSGSMEPTLEAGDGFVAVPAAVSGPVDEGDVVVFEAIELQGGGLTTHRVVGETAGGYVTRGDNNPFRDQEGDEPVVTEDRIVATALQLNGQVVRIPGLGSGIEAVRNAAENAETTAAESLGFDATVGSRGISGLFVSLGLALLLVVFVDDLRSSRRRNRTRDRSRADGEVGGRRIVLALALLILLPANAAMIASTGTQQVTIDEDATSVETESGEMAEANLMAENDGLIAMLVILETSHPEADISPNELAVPRGESATATMTVTAPAPGEQTVVSMSEHRYFLVAPPSLIARLHSIHPLASVAAFNLLGLGTIATIVGAIFGFGNRRVRERRRDVSLARWIKRLIR